MDLVLAAVAETLADEFADLRNSTVVRVLSDCVDEFPHDDALFIEHAVRARLSVLEPREPTNSDLREPDSLDVSLHDGDLREEVELMVHLMVAANESETPLSQRDVDRILGIYARGDAP